ncbi:calcineurin-like phosphoesterase family protein [Limibacter armeniacum]|uniref:calcineurin-like phosphoesterase family protein n=1 Tax=Limibacter armeniacum TaxID=466084 RepID=UPI002FE60276
MAQKRRSFLKSLGITMLGAPMMVGGLSAREKKGATLAKDLSAIELRGRVMSGGKGLVGVAVTDGINVVLTDTKGRYELLSNATAEFVHISIPRGYEFPNQDGITQFFQKIAAKNGQFVADFELKKLQQDDTKHNFIVWADPQIRTAADAKLLNTDSAPDTAKLIRSYGSGVLFHGIGCGDLVWDKFELFEDYRQAIKQTGIPYFQVIGNHDMDLDARTDDYSAVTFKKQFGPTYYSYNRGEIHYVVLDDVFFIGKSKKYIGYITEQQFAWLEQDLAHVKPGATVVVSVHIPVNTGTQRRDNLKDEPIGGVVANRRELYRILKPFKAHIMSGHTHFNEKMFDSENVIEHVHGTVCGAWWTGPICQDGTPGGYGVYEVNGADISWYHKATGKERNHQFRVYPVGAVEDFSDEFSVNVWNWDPEWKVEWLEDGVVKGEMNQRTVNDPWSMQLHLGPAKPSIRKWVEPILTDHMFFAKPSAQAQTVTIRVTDRFKQVYQKEVNLKTLKLGEQDS